MSSDVYSSVEVSKKLGGPGGWDTGAPPHLVGLLKSKCHIAHVYCNILYYKIICQCNVISQCNIAHYGDERHQKVE